MVSREPSATAWRRSAASTSSAPTGTRAVAWTCSCAAARDGRAIPASRGSSSASKTSCSCATASPADSAAVPPEPSPTRPSTTRSSRREIARAQRIVEGQNFEIRRTLERYAAVVEEQHRRLIERRQAMLSRRRSAGRLGRERRAPRGARRCGGRGAPSIDAERAVTLGCIDRAWRDHLALCADLREGIHLVRLGGQDPLTRFTSDAIRGFSQIDEAIDEAVLAALATVRVAGASST